MADVRHLENRNIAISVTHIGSFNPSFSLKLWILKTRDDVRPFWKWLNRNISATIAGIYGMMTVLPSGHGSHFGRPCRFTVRIMIRIDGPWTIVWTEHPCWWAVLAKCTTMLFQHRPSTQVLCSWTYVYMARVSRVVWTVAREHGPWTLMSKIASTASRRWKIVMPITA